MSSKGRHYAGKHSVKRNKKSKSPKVFLIMGIIVLIIALAVVTVFFFGGKGNENKEEKEESSVSSTSTEETVNSEKAPVAEKAEIEETEETSYQLKKGLKVEKIGSYTGIYMEDGSDEVVSGIAMIIVKNEGEEYIQYAEITVKSGKEEGKFTLSTLFPGETVVILEQNRKEYEKFSSEFTAEANNVAVFSEVPTLCEEKIKIQPLNGAMNVTNISGENIEGDVVIYYKNSADDMYYGGITYRVRITGGIKAGEIKQIITDHFSKDGSTVVFATVG